MGSRNTGARRHRDGQSGNVIFIILIAIVLLAALTFSVTKSQRSGMGSMTPEKAALAANEILSYSSTVENAVQQMMMAGTLDNELCFDSPKWPPKALLDNDHAGCAVPRNKVFDPAGGGVTFQDANDEWFAPEREGTDWTWGDWLFMDRSNVYNLGTSENELVMFLGPIRREICLNINKKLGISSNSGSATDPVPYDYICCGWDHARQYGWSDTFYYAVDSIGWDDGPDPTELAGRTAGCGVESGGARYYFYKVLVTR